MNRVGLVILLPMGVFIGSIALYSRHSLVLKAECQAAPYRRLGSVVQHHRPYNCDDGGRAGGLASAMVWICPTFDRFDRLGDMAKSLGTATNH